MNTAPHLTALHASFARAAEALWPGLNELLPGLSLEVVGQTDSTNTQLLQRARAADASPTLLVALEQTAGRGRQGRRWYAEPGESLTFSLAVPWLAAQSGQADRDMSGLSLAVGVALAEALDASLQLKWPNDLWLNGRKLGGVLIEVAPLASSATQRMVVVGVGINIAGASSWSASLAGHSASHAEVPAVDQPADGAKGPDPVGVAAVNEVAPLMTAAQAFELIAPALVRAWVLFEQGGWEPFAGRFAQRDALFGRAVQLWLGGKVVDAGTAQGVDELGRLLVHTAHGLQAWSSGEVSVRLAPASGTQPPSTP